MSPARDPVTHARFVSKLDRSEHAVWLVAQWLHACKKSIMIPAKRVAPRHEDWAEHVDGGDLWIIGEGDKPNLRVEVRHIGTSFKGREDWKHGKFFMVQIVEAFARYDPRPNYWIALSHDTQCLAFVNVDKTIDSWYAQERTHGPNATEPGKKAQHWFCPLDLITWHNL